MKFRIDTEYNMLGESIYTLHQKLPNGRWFHNSRYSFKSMGDALEKARGLKYMSDLRYERTVTGEEFELL